MPGSGCTSSPRTDRPSRPGRLRAQVLANGRQRGPCLARRRSPCAAPRDSASIPTAPLPAYRSSTRASSTRSARMPKRVSLTRSLIGRMPRSRGADELDAARRAGDDPHAPAGRQAQPVALVLPRRRSRRAGAASSGREASVGSAATSPPASVARPLGQGQVSRLEERGDPQRRQAGLPRAEQVARAAQAQVGLGDGEAVVRAAHHLEPLRESARRRHR